MASIRFEIIRIKEGGGQASFTGRSGGGVSPCLGWVLQGPLVVPAGGGELRGPGVGGPRAGAVSKLWPEPCI